MLMLLIRRIKKAGRNIKQSRGKMEKRKYQRVTIENLSVDVSDGIGFFPGVISDVSRFGMSMADLSTRLNVDVKKMTVVISGKGGHFKMNVRPRWSIKDGHRKSLGAEISTAPLGWTEFVMNFERVFNNDVWGEIRL
jgi:hypothetical protein